MLKCFVFVAQMSTWVNYHSNVTEEGILLMGYHEKISYNLRIGATNHYPDTKSTKCCVLEKSIMKKYWFQASEIAN